MDEKAVETYKNQQLKMLKERFPSNWNHPKDTNYDRLTKSTILKMDTLDEQFDIFTKQGRFLQRFKIQEDRKIKQE